MPPLSPERRPGAAESGSPRSRQGPTSIALALLAACGWALLPPGGAGAAPGVRSIVEKAVLVVEEITIHPDESIPANLLHDAKGIAILPEVKKVGFGIGFRWGQGVFMPHTEKGWGQLYRLRLEGGSFGLQAGVEWADTIILVIRSQKVINSLKRSDTGRLTLGVDANIAVGPKGQHAERQLDADILTYYRSKGIFLGISLGNAELIRGERLPPSPAAEELKEKLAIYAATSIKN